MLPACGLLLLTRLAYKVRKLACGPFLLTLPACRFLLPARLAFVLLACGLLLLIRLAYKVRRLAYGPFLLELAPRLTCGLLLLAIG